MRIIIYISIFTSLTVVGAYIKIPFPVVPITLQTFFVLLSGNLLGGRFGALSQIIYIMLGLIGLPVFAFGGGLSYIIKPTFGYIMALPLGAFVSGVLIQLIFKQQKKSSYSKEIYFIKICLVNFVSILIILIVGVCYLYLNLNFITGKGIGFSVACWSGFIIFLPGAILKIIIASLVTVKIKKYFVLID